MGRCGGAAEGHGEPRGRGGRPGLELQRGRGVPQEASRRRALWGEPGLIPRGSVGGRPSRPAPQGWGPQRRGLRLPGSVTALEGWGGETEPGHLLPAPKGDGSVAELEVLDSVRRGGAKSIASGLLKPVGRGPEDPKRKAWAFSRV